MGVAVLVDYDGTITDIDTFDALVRLDAGPGPWHDIEGQLARGELTLRAAMDREASYVRMTLDEADRYLDERVRVDPAFAAFVAACEERGYDLTVVSSGIEPLIRRALARAGLERLAVIANDVTPSPDGWRLTFRDGSANGTDKAAIVRAARERGDETIFIGDGLSDFDAAVVADRRFAKRNKKLASHLRERELSFESFSTFAEIIDLLF